MTRRAARPTDTFLRPLLQQSYPKQEWTEADVERRLEEEGIHHADDTRLAYCHLTYPVRTEPLGPVPVGPCTQIATLIPQHRKQKWVDEVLAPLLAEALRREAKERPDLMEQPLYCYLDPDLYPFWTSIIPVEIIPRRSGSYLAWLPTVNDALERLVDY